MKIRYLLLTLVGLATGLALPIFAQEPNAPDPQLREQLLAFSKKHDEAFLNSDAAAMAALFTENGVLVNDSGPIYGREAIEKSFENMFKVVHFSKHLSIPGQYSPQFIGTDKNAIWATGEWGQTVQGQNFGPLEEKGFWTDILVREGDDLNIKVGTWNRLKVY
jgi:Domain of unknown function (DUF4440)